ncbi:MAG: SRPBCC family protein [Bacteroidetes bacterium]|nr:SRPBCC family protein [Bacteroidota bacterium]
MRRIFIALIIALVFTSILLGISALFFPSTWKFQKKITINAPIEKVFEKINDLKTWPEWSAWSADRLSKFTYECPGNTVGVGGCMKWSSKKLGNGIITITESIHNARIGYKIDMVSYRASKGQIIIFPTEDGKTEVIWENAGKVGKYNPIGKYIALFAGKTIGRDIEYSLERLQDKLEK